MGDVVTKRCSLCREELPVDQFHVRRDRGHSRRSSACKSCANQRAKVNYRRRKQEYRTPFRKGEPLRIDAVPFAEWLVGLIENELRWALIHRMPAPGTYAVSQVVARTGLTPKTIYDLRNGFRRTIHIDLVDRALINEGSTTLRELYPALFDFDQQEAAAA